MPFFNNRVQGQLPAGDIFMFGWWAESTVGVQAMADLVEAWITDLWTNELQALYTTNTTVARVVVGEYDSINGAQQQRAENGVALAGSVDEDVTPPLPGDVALVVSLQTNLANRRGRGRFYLPAMATNTVNATGRLMTTHQTNIAAEVAAQFGLFNAAAPPGLIVASRSNDAGTTVQRVAVGNLFDTQRRRENAVIESREVVDL